MLPEIESKIFAIKLTEGKKVVVGKREHKVIINYNYFHISTTTAACWAIGIVVLTLSSATFQILS